MAKLLPKNHAGGVRSYLTFAAVVGTGVGLLWIAGVRKPMDALVAAGIAFIVTLVGVATLALAVKDDEINPDKPRLK